jgi:hypothetical protein
MTTGYFPGVGTIGDKIVCVENRDGNANVKTAQEETLERGFMLLNNNEIYINRSRMDAGSFSQKIIAILDKYSKLFYVRANRSADMTGQIRQISQWKTVEINFKEYQVASLPFKQFFEDKNYRLVVMREKTEDQQLDIFTGDNFKYRCILTNDHESSEKEVIEYYNQRGSNKKTFDIQNNDFGWKHLPTSNMSSNTVYLILTAMMKNFCNYLVQKISKVFTGIKPTSRLKRFIFQFIAVSGKWVHQRRQWKLRLYSDRPYEKL